MMNESLIEKLARMQKEIDALKLIKQSKPNNYDDALSSIKEENKKIKESIDVLNKNKAIDIESEVKKVVDIAYVTHLYRNK